MGYRGNVQCHDVISVIFLIPKLDRSSNGLSLLTIKTGAGMQINKLHKVIMCVRKDIGRNQNNFVE